MVSIIFLATTESDVILSFCIQQNQNEKEEEGKYMKYVCKHFYSCAIFGESLL